MKTKILLNENTTAYNEVIANAKQYYSNGKTLLTMLEKLGLTFDSLNDWEVVERELSKDFPKATLKFNLQALGIEALYIEAETFYLKHRHTLSFEPLTDDQAEAIREKQRVYADKESQIEAFELFNTVKDSLLKLQALGIAINIDKTYLVSRVLIGDSREKPPLKLDKTALFHALINLK